MKKLALTITILLAVLTIVASPTEAVNIERDALMALYNSTDGPNWLHNDNWGGDDPCDPVWWGVHCDAGNVTELDMSSPGPPKPSGNGLNGPIPPELGNLSSLQRLDLRCNYLRGPIPPELGNLSNLEILDLGSYHFGYNYLSGSIPPELGNLSNLTDLNLDWNQLSGPIPSELSNLSNLVRLVLRGGNWELTCWQTQAALVWAQGLPYYAGPEAYCRFVNLPVVVSAAD